MKREGRQHGMVRSYMILPSPLNPTPKSKIINRLDSRPTAGSYTKVSTKPTNHSKFTGKCGTVRCTDCHAHPVNKSKDKAKGNQKLKSCSLAALNHRSLTWRVVDKGNGYNYDGKSATGILSHMSSEFVDDYDDEVEDYDDDEPYALAEEVITSQGTGVVLDDLVEEDEGWCVL